MVFFNKTKHELIIIVKYWEKVLGKMPNLRDDHLHPVGHLHPVYPNYLKRYTKKIKI
jgi:hypothetical protein